MSPLLADPNVGVSLQVQLTVLGGTGVLYSTATVHTVVLYRALNRLDARTLGFRRWVYVRCQSKAPPARGTRRQTDLNLNVDEAK